MEKNLNRRAVLGGALALPLLAHQAAGQTSDSSMERAMDQKIRFSFADQSFTAMLYDNATVRDFLTMLPLDLKIEDYSTNEKITYLPRKLTDSGAGPFGNEAPGDICYYMPWGNLALYHSGYRYSAGLIRLGRFDDGPAPLQKRGTFPLQITLVS